MHVWTLTLVAVALAMDAFAASVASGIAINRLHLRHALTIAAWFGAFQALMPFLGWVCGTTVRGVAGAVDHWVVLGLLTLIGGKMIVESFEIKGVEERSNPMDIYVLFMLSIATSVDAFAVGISFAILGVSIIAPIVVIGVVTFIMSFCGVWIGDRVGHFFERRIEAVAGILLIGIGVRILVLHLLQGI